MSWHSIHHGRAGAYVRDPATGELHPDGTSEAAALIAAASAAATSGFSTEIEAADAATPYNPADDDRADGVVSDSPETTVSGEQLPDLQDAQQNDADAEAPPGGGQFDELNRRRRKRRQER